MKKNLQIEYLRKENGYSQDQLAEMLNVSRQTISEWERDKNMPSVEKLLALSEIFHVSLDYIITGKEFEGNRLNNLPNNFKLSKLNNTSSYLFGRKNKLFVSTEDNENIGHTLVIGSAGTGKGRAIINPNIIQAAKRGDSILCNDVFLEHYHNTKEILEACGYRVICMGSKNGDYNDSICWNMYDEISADFFYSEKYLRLIYDDMFRTYDNDEYFNRVEYNIFRDMSYYVISDENNSHVSIYAIYNLIKSCDYEKVRTMFDILPAGHPSKKIDWLNLCSKDVINSCLHSLSLKMEAALNYKSFEEKYKESGFTINELLNNKVALFMSSNVFDANMNKIQRVFFDMFAYKILESGKSKNNISFFFDEFACYGDNDSSLKNIKNMLRYTNFTGLSVTICIQSLHQLENAISDMTLEYFISLFTNVVGLGSCGGDDCFYLSKLFDVELMDYRTMMNKNMIVKRNNEVIYLDKYMDYKELSI